MPVVLDGARRCGSILQPRERARRARVQRPARRSVAVRTALAAPGDLTRERRTRASADDDGCARSNCEQTCSHHYLRMTVDAPMAPPDRETSLNRDMPQIKEAGGRLRLRDKTRRRFAGPAQPRPQGAFMRLGPAQGPQRI